MRDRNHVQAGLRALHARRELLGPPLGRPRTALLISPTPTHPCLGGASARVRTLLSALGELGFDTHFALIERDHGDHQAMQAAFGDRFHAIDYRFSWREAHPIAKTWRKLKRFAGLRSAWLWGVDDIYDPLVEPALTALDKRWGFDLILVEYVFFSKALRLFGKHATKIIDMHDVFGDRHQMYLAAGQKPEWLSVRPADELNALRRADHALAIQENEAQQMRQLGLNEVSVVSHFVALSDAAARIREQQVLFVGSGNDANRRGLSWFVKEVWPQVRARCPQARLTVAGDAGQVLERTPGVQVLGRVSDEALVALYLDARVAVNPVFTGSGQSIKVLEAAGQGVPVVATQIGVRGIAGALPPAVNVIDDAQNFSRVLIELLVDDQLGLTASIAAHRLAAESNAMQLASLAQVCGLNQSEQAVLASEPRRAVDTPGACNSSEKSGRTTPIGVTDTQSG